MYSFRCTDFQYKQHLLLHSPQLSHSKQELVNATTNGTQLLGFNQQTRPLISSKHAHLSMTMTVFASLKASSIGTSAEVQRTTSTLMSIKLLTVKISSRSYGNSSQVYQEDLTRQFHTDPNVRISTIFGSTSLKVQAAPIVIKEMNRTIVPPSKDSNLFTSKVWLVWVSGFQTTK